MERDPRLSTPVWLGIVAVLAFSVSIYFQTAKPGEIIWIGLPGGVGAVFGLASVVSGINWVVFMWWQRDIESRRARAVTPMLELMQAVGRLNSDQIGLVGLQDYRAIVEIASADNGPIYMLRTVGGAIPMSFVESTLRAATPLGLPAIRQYADGSPEREWARLFAQWCVDMHLAIPANGPYSAQWIERGGRYKAASVLGLQLSNQNFEAVEE